MTTTISIPAPIKPMSEFADGFSLTTLPCNPLPFIGALYHGCKEDPRWLCNDQARAIMLTVLMQSFGQFATIHHKGRSTMRVDEQIADLWQGCKDGGTDWITSGQAKTKLLDILVSLYGTEYCIDIVSEWFRLYKKLF